MVGKAPSQGAVEYLARDVVEHRHLEVGKRVEEDSAVSRNVTERSVAASTTDRES